MTAPTVEVTPEFLAEMKAEAQNMVRIYSSSLPEHMLACDHADWRHQRNVLALISRIEELERLLNNYDAYNLAVAKGRAEERKAVVEYLHTWASSIIESTYPQYVEALRDAANEIQDNRHLEPGKEGGG